MLCGQLPCHTTRHAYHQRHGKLATGHERNFCGHVDDGIERQQGKVDGHDFYHRPHASHCRTDAQPGKAAFRDGGITDTPVTAFGMQSLGNPVGAAIQANIFTQYKYGLVTRHFNIQCPVKGLP